MWCNRTVTEDGEKAPALKFGQPRVMALLVALTCFQHLVNGFHNRDLRELVADLLGLPPEQYTTAQMSYDLRRLRLVIGKRNWSIAYIDASLNVISVPPPSRNSRN